VEKIVEPERSQMIVRLMRILCYVLTASNTQPRNMQYLLLFCYKNGFAKRTLFLFFICQLCLEFINGSVSEEEHCLQ